MQTDPEIGRKTEIFLIRHAESAPDESLPDSEWPLSSNGIGQAVKLSENLRGLGIQALFSSPYPRSVNTLRPLAEMLELEIQIHHDLRERELCEGLRSDWMTLLKRTWDDFDFALGDGESSRSCQSRMNAAVLEIARMNFGRKIGVGSHGNSIALLLHGIDPSFGFVSWSLMGNPEVFKVVLSDGLLTWDRAWKVS
jgi:2,3-bisphosphoglycerate-dependent phosphoglycerate mutase